jgi:hypothetical protein
MNRMLYNYKGEIRNPNQEAAFGVFYAQTPYWMDVLLFLLTMPA